MSAFFSWSGGKDSMLALHRALDGGHDVRALLAMFDETGERSRLHALPPHPMQDACGENGEFHTFVFDGPRFAQAVPHRLVAVHELKPVAPAPGHCFVAELR